MCYCIFEVNVHVHVLCVCSVTRAVDRVWGSDRSSVWTETWMWFLTVCVTLLRNRTHMRAVTAPPVSTCGSLHTGLRYSTVCVCVCVKMLCVYDDDMCLCVSVFSVVWFWTSASGGLLFCRALWPHSELFQCTVIFSDVSSWMSWHPAGRHAALSGLRVSVSCALEAGPVGQGV